MNKATITEYVTAPKYPCLMIGTVSRAVFLMTSAKEGVKLCNANGEVSGVHSTWGFLEPFYGTVELSS